MAFYGRDYYRENYDVGYRPGTWERGRWGWLGMPGERGAQRAYGGYEAPLRGPGPMVRNDRFDSGDRDWFRSGADYQRTPYDRGYKSRWQTDYGDPYGDRIRHTPMRLVREGSRGYPSGPAPYGRDFDRYPYPVSERSFSPRGGYDTQFGMRGGRYPSEDTGWI